MITEQTTEQTTENHGRAGKWERRIMALNRGGEERIARITGLSTGGICEVLAESEHLTWLSEGLLDLIIEKTYGGDVAFALSDLVREEYSVFRYREWLSDAQKSVNVRHHVSSYVDWGSVWEAEKEKGRVTEWISSYSGSRMYYAPEVQGPYTVANSNSEEEWFNHFSHMKNTGRLSLSDSEIVCLASRMVDNPDVAWVSVDLFRHVARHMFDENVLRTAESLLDNKLFAILKEAHELKRIGGDIGQYLDWAEMRGIKVTDLSGQEYHIGERENG